MAEIERELNEAQHRVETAKTAYELIVRRMSQELARFQRERATEMVSVPLYPRLHASGCCCTLLCVTMPGTCPGVYISARSIRRGWKGRAPHGLAGIA